MELANSRTPNWADDQNHCGAANGGRLVKNRLPQRGIEQTIQHQKAGRRGVGTVRERSDGETGHM